MARMTETSRREFLIQISSVGALLATPIRLRAQGTLPTRAIPSSGEALPIVGLGSTKPVLGLLSDGPEPLASVMRMLVARGGRVVDSAPRTADIDAEFGRLMNDLDIHSPIVCVLPPARRTGGQAGRR